MKRMLLVLGTLCCLAVPAARSQTFFYHAYGNYQSKDRASGSCLSSINSSASHCITGLHVQADTDPIVDCIAVSRPDLNGQTINPDNFNLFYRLEDHLQRPCPAEGIAITEFDNNGRAAFGITGVFSMPGGAKWIFIMAIDEFGTPIMFKGLDFTNVTGERPVAITYGNNGKELVITGNIPTAAPPDPCDIFLVAVDLLGNVKASTIWDLQPNRVCGVGITDDVAYDVLVDPYNTSSDRYYVVGSCVDQYTQKLGFMLYVDNGLALISAEFYTTPTPDLELVFHSIEPAYSQGGFIVGGRYGDRTKDDHALAMLIKSNGPIMWSSYFDYAPIPGTSNTFKDIKEYGEEFYATGTVGKGIFGGQDIHAVHIDKNGIPFPMGDYTYGSDEDDFPVGVETVHGLYFMGGTKYRDSGDFYMVHPDWDGTGTCMTHIAEPNYATPEISSYYGTAFASGFTLNVDLPPLAIFIYGMEDKTICEEVKPLLRNIMQTKPGGADPILFPNPSTGRFAVQLSADATADITVYDLSGRLVYERHTTSAMTEIDASTWNDGMYLVHVGEEGKTKKVLRLVLSH